MKKIIKKIYLFFTFLELTCIKVKASIFGDYILNRYIEKSSERANIYVLNKLGAYIKNSTNLKQGLILDNTYFNYKNLRIDDNCYIGKHVFLDMVKPIIIKREAVISEGVTILTHQDVGNRLLKEYYPRKEGEVILEEGCYIGANSTILCGLTIGKCAVVAAGSVVTKNVPQYTVVGGVPAREIKKL